MVWLRGKYQQKGEEGEAEWQTFWAQITAPPTTRPLSLATTTATVDAYRAARTGR